MQKQNRSAGMYKAVLPQTIASIPLPEIPTMINTLNGIPSMQSAAEKRQILKLSHE